MKFCINLFISTFLVLFVQCSQLEDITSFLDLLEMDLDDSCSNLSLASRDILLKKPNAYKFMITTRQHFGEFSKNESEKMRTQFHISGVNLGNDYIHRWKILEKMGDNELPTEDWIKLTKFIVDTEEIDEELQISCSKIPCDKLPCSMNKSENCKYSRSDVSQMLKNSHDANYLRSVWSSAQQDFAVKGEEYPDILKLVTTAVQENDFASAESYWSNFVDYSDVYSKSRSLWSEIEPFYVKLNKFVRSRLDQLYRIPSNETIPVYLLGSERGIDWTIIADKILPHRYLYDEINASLIHEQIGGRKAYEIADKQSKSLGLKKVEQKFWMRSLFNMSCPSHFLTFCGDKYSQVITCNRTGFTEFLDAHEDMTRASLNSLDYSATFYHKFRYSVIDEAIEQLSTILAMKTMPLNGLIPEEAILASEETSHNQMTFKLLQALRVLPKLSYYFLADEWRLNELEKPSKNVIKSWWEYREKYQMVRGINNDEWDLLGDEYMRSNKPYIGKFLGTILQFQILNHFENNGERHINILNRMSRDKSFKRLIKKRFNDNWMVILQDEFGIYDIETDSLLEYFHSLEEYMENAPLEQVTQTLKPRTTTTVATTTVSTTTTTEAPKPITEKPIEKSIAVLKPKINKENDVIKGPRHDAPLDSTINDESTSKSTMTRTAWIGTLIGIISILIISGIIGKKKCKRHPRATNRRFDA